MVAVAGSIAAMAGVTVPTVPSTWEMRLVSLSFALAMSASLGLPVPTRAAVGESV